MNVLVLSGSPNGTRGNTHRLLEPFLEGLREAGAETEVVQVCDLTVKPCTGCNHCWRNGGQCAIQGDDMSWLLPKVAQAETLVLATPLYVDHLPGALKNVIDRLIPLAEPRIELVEGHCRHPRRAPAAGLRRLVLLSVCGFWELDNFDVLVAWAKAMCRNLHCDFAGKLLRPHAYAFASVPGIAPPKRRVVKAIRQAARELVTEGAITAETETAVAAEMIGRDLYLRLANRSW